MDYLFHCRRLRSSGPYGIILSRSASSPTATRTYFTPSDVRAKSSLVTLGVVKEPPWGPPPHAVRPLDRRSSRAHQQQQLAASCLTQRWMFSRPWSPSLSSLLCSGVQRLWPTFFYCSGLDTLSYASVLKTYFHFKFFWCKLPSALAREVMQSPNRLRPSVRQRRIDGGYIGICIP